MDNLKFETCYIDEGVHAITAVMGEQIYLVEGKEKVMVIDSGLGIGSLLSEIRNVTDLPLLVVNTHGHPDHGGGNAEFDEVYLHPKDHDLYLHMCSRNYRYQDIEAQLGHKLSEEYERALLPLMEDIIFLTDDQQFDLGGRILQVVPAPGHTKGSICLYDHTSGFLFTGDNVSMTDTWLYLDHCEPLEKYIESLERLMVYEKYKGLLPGHAPSPVSADVIEAKVLCAKEIMNDGSIGIPAETFAGTGMRHSSHGVSIIYNPENLYKENSSWNN